MFYNDNINQMFLAFDTCGFVVVPRGMNAAEQ